jgi:hypothetical protein
MVAKGSIKSLKYAEGLSGSVLTDTMDELLITDILVYQSPVNEQMIIPENN